jgi:hypothetical protein
MSIISSPYLQLDTYEWFFRQEPLWLLRPRWDGVDQVMIERVAQSFRDAESMMRPKLFSNRQRERLGRFWVLVESSNPPSRRPDEKGSLASQTPLDYRYWVGCFQYLFGNVSQVGASLALGTNPQGSCSAAQ